MTTPVFVSSTGSNTSPYETWAKAATTLATAITQASTSGDMIAIDAASPPADIAANTTYTALANISIIASTNSGTATITPTTMGTGTWIGNSTTSYNLSFTGAFKVFLYGLTLRIGGAGSVNLFVGNADGGHLELEDCYLWLGTGSAQRIILGPSGVLNAFQRLKNCTFRFGSTGQGIQCAGTTQLEGGSIASAGSAPTTLFANQQNTQAVRWDGGDLSHVTGTLVPSQTLQSSLWTFSQCKVGAGVTFLASQTPANKTSGRVLALDCASGDTHGLFGYYDAFGSVVNDTGIYFTSSPNSVLSGATATPSSWKIVTTANCSYYTPFETPWFGYRNSTLSAVTPYVEIARDVSATAYDNDQVWLDVSAKVTSGSTQATLFTTRMALLGSPAAIPTGAGTGSWSPGGGSPDWSGKLELGSSITPAEVGHIQARVGVGEPSITVYADPQIRV